MEQRWPEKARLVQLRYFAGMTIAEASAAMGIAIALAAAVVKKDANTACIKAAETQHRSVPTYGCRRRSPR